MYGVNEEGSRSERVVRGRQSGISKDKAPAVAEAFVYSVVQA
jgi:hypothetical protein